METPKILIKKYENRRLYDSTNSRYVNLDEIAQMIRDGADVEVQDAKTGEDLTRLTLTQIIVENAKGPDSGLPLDVLRHLVSASDRAQREFFGWYLRSAFETYQKAQEAFQSGLQKAGTVSPNPFELLRGMFGSQNPVPGFSWPSFTVPPKTPSPASPAPPEAAPASTAPPADDFAALRARLDELEQQLKKRPARKRKTKSAK